MINNIKNEIMAFLESIGEGTKFDLDYGKILILILLIYLCFFKEYGV